MYAQNGFASCSVRAFYHDLTVEASWAQKSRVKHIWAVGGCQHHNGFMRVKAVHLDQNLIKGLFAFVVAPSQSSAALATDRVEFIDEDDARGAFPGSGKEVTNATRPNADQHLDEFGGRHREKRHVGFAGNGSGEQGLAGPRRANQQDAFRNLATEPLETGRGFEKLDDLDQFGLRLVNACDISKGGLSFVAAIEPGTALAEREDTALGTHHAPAQPPEKQSKQEDGSDVDQQI